MRVLLTFFTLWLLCAASSFAQTSVVDSPSADKTYLTIYPDDLGLVTEVRTVSLPAGRSTIRFFGVSDQIISQSATLLEFSGISLERNFTSDLITRSNLLSKAVGQSVTVTRINKAKGTARSERATIIASSPSTGTILDIGGRYEAVECSGLGEAISFDGLPDGVSADPILSIDVSSEMAGETELTISYLTRGLSWEADYRLDVLPGATQGPLLGWLTVQNRTSKNFKDVPTAIVAGELNRVETADSQGIYATGGWQSAACWRKGTTKAGVYRSTRVAQKSGSGYYGFDGSVMPEPAPMMSVAYEDEIIVTGAKRQAKREDLGDYKLYRTPQPVTVAPMQTKQIAFLAVQDAEFEPVYAFNYPANDIYAVKNAAVEYRIDNDKDGNLGQPLPKGTVRVMTRRANGKTAYLGEDSIENSAVNLPVDVKISDSIAVTLDTDFAANTTVIGSKADYSLTLSAEISNATNAPILSEIEITQVMIRAGNVASQTHKPDPEKDVPTYAVPVPAQGTANWAITLPVEPIYEFDLEDVEFGVREAGKTDKNTASLQYRLREGGGQFWPTPYFQAPSASRVTIESTLMSFAERVAPDGQLRESAQLRHVFENKTNADIIVAHTLPDWGDDVYSLSDMSAQPSQSDPYIWNIDVPAQGKSTLTYRIEIEEMPF